MSPQIPNVPFIAVFGSHPGRTWRPQVEARLRREGIPSYHPTGPHWQGITEQTGDSRQALVDELVVQQQRALWRAACVVFHLGGIHPRTGEPLVASAARTELGLLAGAGIPTFAHIHPQALGRNYLWALLKLYPGHMCSASSLDECVDLAVTWFRAQGADTGGRQSRMGAE